VDAARLRLHGPIAVQRPSSNLLDRTVALVVAAAASGAAGACSAGEPPAPSAAPFGVASGPGTSATTPTWFRDVEPIMERACVGCHVVDGTGGFPLDRVNAKAVASLMAERTAARDMPPWPPSSAGAPLAGSRTLGTDAIAILAAWALAGGPDGDPRDHVERAPRVPSLPSHAADVRLELRPGEAYSAPSNPFVTDEVRCFVLDLPAGHDGLWVTAARWHAETPRGVRSVGGTVVDARGAAAARARSARDGRAGFECAAGLGDLAAGPALGATGPGGPAEDATQLPAGTAVRLPAGGAVVMRVHYAVKHLDGATDRSNVELWAADESARRSVRPVIARTVTAPVEVPCPTGASNDPASACSRENAFGRLAGADAVAARARADARLTACGTDLARATQATASGDHLFVTTSCTSVAPWEGTLAIVQAHLQTHGASVLVEVEQGDGTWSAALDISRWRWGWEGTYLLERGLPVPAGRRLRVSCTFDNGAGNQWSALTGEPGHDAPARPPQLAPGYLVDAPNRAAEACRAVLGLARAPYRAMSWPTLCHEAQAVRDDACGAGADLVSRGCTPADEDASVAILSATPERLCALP
jgi:hypothetical protein